MGFRWDAKRIKAAQLLAEDTMSRARIAEECGVTPATITNWRNEPEFADRVRELVQALDDEVSQLRFAKRRERIRALDEMASDLLTIRDERGRAFAEAGTWVTDPETGETAFIPAVPVPGGKTGRIIRQVKIVGQGKSAQPVIEYAYDASVDKAFRETLVHIAKERGEWSEGKREITGPNGTPLLPIREIVVQVPAGFDDDDDGDE